MVVSLIVIGFQRGFPFPYMETDRESPIRHHCLGDGVNSTGIPVLLTQNVAGNGDMDVSDWESDDEIPLTRQWEAGDCIPLVSYGDLPETSG